MRWTTRIGWTAGRNRAYGSYEVPDFDINYGLGDRIQLKYEIPIAIEEARPLPATPFLPAQEGVVLGDLGESLLGIKWRFYEHHPGDPPLHNRFGTGLLGAFGAGAHPEPEQPAAASGDAPAAKDNPEQVVNLSVSTYPQLFLDNPTRAVPRGIVSQGPQFFLPIEVNGRIGPIRVDGEVGYNFGNHAVPQSWGRGLIVGHEFSDRTEVYGEFYDVQETNRVAAGQGVGNFATGATKQRELTLGLGGRQALNRAKTVNLLLMGGRAVQKISVDNSQPQWIAYVGLQVLLGPKEERDK